MIATFIGLFSDKCSPALASLRAGETNIQHALDYVNLDETVEVLSRDGIERLLDQAGKNS